MKIHIDEQTIEVEAGRISVIFSIIDENAAGVPVEPTPATDAPTEVADVPVETPAPEEVVAA